MSSLVYLAGAKAALSGKLNFASDTFKVILVTSAYQPDKVNHKTRSDVTNEVNGQGYTAGGLATVCTFGEDDSNAALTAAFGNVAWVNSTITAHAAVIFKSTGDPTTDILVGYVDFGTDVSSQNSAFAVTFSSPIKFQD